MYSADEFQAAARADAVVDRHYAVFDRASLRVVRNAKERQVYVSYRKGDDVFWTRNRVKLVADEPILTDGRNEARARCGNRVSATPQQPVQPWTSTGGGEDPETELELVWPGTGPAIPPIVGAPDVHGPPTLLAPEIFPAPNLPAITAPPRTEPEWIFSGLGAASTYSSGIHPPAQPPQPGGPVPPGGVPPLPLPPPPTSPVAPSGGIEPVASFPSLRDVLPPGLLITIEFHRDGTVSVSPLLPPTSGTAAVAPGGVWWIPSPVIGVFPSDTNGGGWSNPSLPPRPPGPVPPGPVPPAIVDFPPGRPSEPVAETVPEPDARLLVAASLVGAAFWGFRRKGK